jgi:hypothetical protein
VVENTIEILSLISSKGTLSSVNDFDFAGRPRRGFIGTGGGCIELSDYVISGSGEPTATRLRGFTS